MSVRSAVYTDAVFWWLLANEKSAVAQGIRGKRFTIEEHMDWWEKRFTQKTQCLYIIEDPAMAARGIGYVRYGKCGPDELCEREGEAEVSITISPDARRQDWATRSLIITGEWAMAELGVQRLAALIRPGNYGSIRAFERAGYKRVGVEERLGVGLERWERV